ncbi:hypothetical protein M8J76_003486 [Diaphorina citri]|nr:hypothetical protein M8J76_003486 [Diaphorina citri]
MVLYLQPLPQVSLLVTRIHQAIAHCTLELRSPPAPSLSLWKTIQAEIHELLYGYSCRPPKCDKNSRTNLTHTIRYLSQAAQWFCTIFNIPQPQTSAPTFNSTYDESTQCNLDHTLDNTLVTGPPRLNVTNGSEEEADSMFLPESSLTLKSMQERVRRMKYDGDPDLLPPGSGEIRWLVKLFYYLSCQINIAFYDQIQDIYSRESGLPSLILHATLLPPCVVYQYRLHSWAFIPAPKVPVQLPARLSLRSFASWATILKLGFHTILLCAVFGCHYTLGIAMVLLLWFLTALLKYELKRVCSGLFGN